MALSCNRRVFALGLLLLSGCAGWEKPPPLPAPGTVTVRFVPGGDVDSIEVRVYDRLALSAAALIMPGGTTVDSEEIETQIGPAGTAPAFPVNTPGIVQPTVQGSETLSTGQIRIPDRNIYGRDWKDSSIRVELGRSGSQRVMILAAPQPPA